MKITVDGITYEIGSARFRRRAEIRSYYDMMMENGARKRKDYAIYYHFSLTLVPATMNKDDFEAFYEDITSPAGKRDITLEKGDFLFTFSAYLETPIENDLADINPEQTYWAELPLTFSAAEPARRA